MNSYRKENVSSIVVRQDWLPVKLDTINLMITRKVLIKGIGLKTTPNAIAF